MSKLDEVVVVEARGEGHYSGAVECHAMFVPTEIALQYQEEILETGVSFYELDGKHSETEGEVSIHVGLTEMLRSIHESNGNDWVVDERILSKLDIDSDQLAEIREVDKSLKKELEFKTIQVAYFKGYTFEL